jgi:hypothetical protein
MGISFVLLVYFGWLRYEIESGAIEGHWGILYPAELFIGLVIGLMAWRMIITGVQIWRLGRKFDLHPQLGHPDGCGGLEPLGNLCLWNALILTIPGVFLGGWIALIPETTYDPEYITIFYKLLLVPILWAPISFFLPMLSVHRILVAKQTQIQLELDRLGQSIDQLSHQILSQADEMEPEECTKKTKKLEMMRQTYQEYKNYPVWPFNYQILKKFVLSQAVPVLSYFGLGEPLLGAVKAAVELLKGSG